MKLFKYENYKITISEEALLLKPFKTIWNRDRSKNKEKALAELGFIYFLVDPRSDFSYIINEEERAEEIKKQEGFKKNWKIDSVIMEGVELYKKLTNTTSSLLLEDTKVLIDNLRTYLKEIDLNEVDDKGKPIHTLNSISSTIKSIPSMVENIIKIEKAVAEELLENEKIKGSGKKTIFEDGEF